MKILIWLYGILTWIKESIVNYFKKNEKTNQSEFRRTLDFLARYSLIIGIGFFALYMFTPVIEEFRTVRLIVLFWSIANVLAGLGIYGFTSVNYTKALMRGDDNKYSVYERVAMIRMLGDIYKATLALIGLSVFAIYLAQFAKG